MIGPSFMDSDATPSCAICGNPAPRGQECPCEAERLELAVKQAEVRAMDARLHEIRSVLLSAGYRNQADSGTETGSLATLVPTSSSCSSV